jgi:hypothetical protein
MIAAFTALAAQAHAAPDAPDEVEVLLAHIQASHDRLREAGFTYSYTRHYATDGPAPVTSEIHADVAARGLWRRSFRTRMDTYPQREETREIMTRYLVNDEYFAGWLGGTGNAQRLDHRSLEQRPPNSMEMQMAFDDPDPIGYAFGVEGGTLNEIFHNSSPTHNRWEIAPHPDGGELIVLNRYHTTMHNPLQPRSAFVLDPNRGFSIIESRAYHPDGSLARETTVQLQEATPGLWIPASVTQVLHSKPQSGTHENSTTDTSHYTISDVHFDANLSKSDFEIAAMNLPEGTHIVRRHLDGSMSSAVMVNGQPVDSEIIRMLDQAEKESAEAVSNATSLRHQGETGSVISSDSQPLPLAGSPDVSADSVHEKSTANLSRAYFAGGAIVICLIAVGAGWMIWKARCSLQTRR